MSLTQMIESELPYDGPHDPDTVCEAAQGVAVLLRYLNNATGPWNAPRTLQHAPTVDVIVGEIDAVARGLHRLLTQLADALNRQADDPTMYDDRRDRPASSTADDAAFHIRAAWQTAGDLAVDLNTARGMTVHLGHDLDAGEEGER
jgi:hypothetical protein